MNKKLNISANISAIIVAAGKGLRLGGEIPKQYQYINGKMVLDKTVKSLINNENISNICVVISQDHEELFQLVKEKYPSLDYCYGGILRQDSVKNGLEFLKKYNPDYVLIHDAARPFTTEQVINGVIEALSEYKAVLPAVAVKDTLKKIENHNKSNIVSATIDRAQIFMAQTPQGFDFDLIYNLHQKYSGVKEFTDDCAMAEAENIPVKIVAGDYKNYKITTQEDIQMQKQIRTGNGFDVHEFEAGENIILCGVEIPHHKKLKGHSDADCAWHALTDAILGAIAKGDIGEHFPDTDSKWKGVGSDIFLKYANEEVIKIGGELINIDITIICEEPKLKQYKSLMQESTARLLGIETNRVNVKATTTEKLGFLGRKEGLAVLATANVSI